MPHTRRHYPVALAAAADAAANRTRESEGYYQDSGTSSQEYVMETNSSYHVVVAEN